MKKNLRLLSFLPLIAFLPCASASDVKDPVEAESSLHYNMALNHIKNDNLGEAARVLNEVIFYYDTENLPAYKLLITVLKKMGNEKRAKEIANAYEDVKKMKHARKSGKFKNLTPLDILEKGLPKQKIGACAALAGSKDKNAIPYLIKALADPYFDFYFGNFSVRRAASSALRQFGDEAFPSLADASASGNDDLRWWSLETIISMEVSDPLLAKQKNNIIIRGLSDRSDKVVAAALRGAISLKGKAVVKNILPLASSPEASVRRLCAIALGEQYVPADPYAAEIKRALVQLTQDADKSVATSAMGLLPKTGSEQEFRPILLSLAKDENKDTVIRWYAIKTLGELLGGKKIKELEAFLSHEDIWLRSAAAVALGNKQAHAPGDRFTKEKDILGETALQLSLTAPSVFEEARVKGLEKALDYLASIQKDDGSYPSYFPLGTAQLAALCFLNNGHSSDNPVVKKSVGYMLAHVRDDGSIYSDIENSAPGDKKITFTTALGVRVLAAIGESQYDTVSNKAMEWLKSIQNADGGFGYYKGSRSDMTCTSFVLTALSEGYGYHGIEKNDEVWIKALDYLKSMQNKDGGFGYSHEKRSSYGSATASGLLSLYYAGAETRTSGKAWEWVAKNYSWDTNPFDANPNHYQYYVQELAVAFHLYNKENIKDADGVEHSWHNDVLKKLIKEQDAGGWWVTGQEPLFTAYFVKVLQLRPSRVNLEGM